MTQRNPMNDRYQNEEHRGTTRKSAASAKPKTKAAASVRVQPKEKTKQQKRADKKVVRQKQTDLDRKYYNPPTAQYKRLRKMWWGLLIGAIVMTAISWFARSLFPEPVTYVTLGLAYLCIIGALYVDFSKIRKVRRAYQEEMEAGKSKEQRAFEKQQKAEQRELKKEAEQKYEAAKTEEESSKGRGLFGTGFRLPGFSRDSSDKQESVESSDASGQPEEKNEVFARAKARAQNASKDTHDADENTSRKSTK